MGSVNIRKRGKYYQYQFEVAPIAGKRKQVTKSGFKTKAEAQEEGTKAYNEYITTGLNFKESEISYSDYLDFWLEKYCKVNLRYSTIQTYKAIIENFLKPDLGKYRLSAITSVKLNSYMSELCMKTDYAKTYYSKILKVLKGTFRDACDLFGFLRYNPTITLRLPRIEEDKKEANHIYTQEEIDTILNRFSYDETFTCAFLTACYTGMRTGEVCALTWDDIDLENAIIHVKHNVYDKPADEKGRWFIGKTKTISGIRDVHICNTLLYALNNYKKKQSEYKKTFKNQYKTYHKEEVKNEYGKVVEYRIVEDKGNVISLNNMNLVFVKNNGVYVGTDITRYPFKIIHEELNIKKCRFYDLRGSYATKILNSGVEIRDVADMLGHKNIETTENYYITSLDENRNKASKKFDKIINSDIINMIASYR